MYTIKSIGQHLKTYNVAPHCHDLWEVVYCTSGYGEFTFSSGKKISYQENEIVVIPPFIIHKNYSDTGFTNIHLTFDNVNLPFNSPTLICDNSNSSIYSALTQACYFYNCEVLNKQNILSSLGELIANYLISFSSTSRYSSPVEIIRNEIIKNISNCYFDLRDIIENLPFNYDYLRKTFKKETGISPLQFLIETRLTLAKKLLNDQDNNNLTISEVASMCGFEDPLYFSRIFKKHYDVSPKEFLIAKSDKAKRM